ncbi:MAG: helix-turn-helix domain-containing protein [Mycobacteriales bacterium]
MSNLRSEVGTIPQLTLGWRLKMSLRDISVEDMADELGVSRATLSRWMTDRGAPPKSAYLKVWAMRTGVPLEWLRDGNAPSSPNGPNGADVCASRDLNPEPADLEHYRADLRLYAAA